MQLPDKTNPPCSTLWYGSQFIRSLWGTTRHTPLVHRYCQVHLRLHHFNVRLSRHHFIRMLACLVFPFCFGVFLGEMCSIFIIFLYIFLVFCPASCHQVPGLRSFESALIIFCFRSSLSPISCSCKAQSAMAFLSAEGRISICWAGFLGFFFGIMLKALLMELQGMSGACSLRSVAGCLCSVVGCGC